MPVYTYDPSKVELRIATYKLPGCSSISASFDVKPFKTVQGIRGTAARVRDKRKQVNIQVTVLQTSMTNSVLSEIHRLDCAHGTGRMEITLQDLSGETLLYSDTAYIEGYPDFEFTSEAGTRTWVIKCMTSRDVKVGSNFKAAIDLF